MKKMLPIIQAYVDGKVVEYQYAEGKWKVVEDYEFLIANCDKPRHYRIKPEPKYRPFDEGHECFEEMKKHEPFGWVILDGAYRTVVSIQDSYLHIDTELRHFESMFNHARFADGTPFGIKEGGEE